MKRHGNLYVTICSTKNLIQADEKARIGKKKQYGVKTHNKQRGCNIITLHNLLAEREFRTSTYNHFKLYDPKERDISGLPYYPDRIVHHAIMNPLERVFISTFTADTYSCIKDKGIHAAKNDLECALKDVAGTTYCLKLDIKKFYPSIDHDILKRLLRKKIKDNDLLWLLDEIIDSAPGVPIGNYLSQFFANFYLCYFDHWLKEVKRIKYYFRYADDLVILSVNKQYLHKILEEIKLYLGVELKLTVKKNYQVFPVKARGIDFLGYVFYHTHVFLRKTIKKKFARAVRRKVKMSSIEAHIGWAIHCNSNHLLKKLLPDEHLQRLRNRRHTKNKLLRGQKNRNSRRAERRNYYSRLQDRAKSIS